jgi:hypothetical protein
LVFRFKYYGKKVSGRYIVKHEISRNAIRAGLPFIVIVTLLLSSAIPVLADNSTKPVPQSRLVQGEVISVASDNSSFVLQNGGRQQVTITVDSNTKYFVVPGGKTSTQISGVIAKDKAVENEANKAESRPPQAAGLKDSGIMANYGIDPNGLERYGREAQFSDIQIGDRVIAWAKTAGNLAAKVLITKAPVIQKVKGTISAVSDSSITITPSNGAAITLTWDVNTRFMLKGLISVQAGQYAVAVYNRNSMTAVTMDVQAAAPVVEAEPNT